MSANPHFANLGMLNFGTGEILINPPGKLFAAAINLFTASIAAFTIHSINAIVAFNGALIIPTNPPTIKFRHSSIFAFPSFEKKPAINVIAPITKSRIPVNVQPTYVFITSQAVLITPNMYAMIVSRYNFNPSQTVVIINIKLSQSA